MSEFQLEILKTLDTLGSIASTLQTFPDKTPADVLSALNSLKAHNKLDFSKRDIIYYVLTKEGEDIVKNGSHEILLVKLIHDLGKLQIKDVMSKMGGSSGKVGQARAFKNGWIVKTKENELVLSEKLAGMKLDELEDTTRDTLMKLSDHKLSSTVDDKTVADFKKRELINVKKRIRF